MRNGYEIRWTTNALKELKATIKYLEKNFSDKEVKKFAFKTESIARLISQNPFLFPKSEFKNVHKVVIMKFNTMYYRVDKDEVQI